MAPYEHRTIGPVPLAFRRKRPSDPKKDRAPPHLRSRLSPGSPARNDPDWMKSVWLASRSVPMSPGRDGARVISPGPPRDVNVLANSVSPPRTVRVRAPKTPPFIEVSISRFDVMLTIAPA